MIAVPKAGPVDVASSWFVRCLQLVKCPVMWGPQNWGFEWTGQAFTRGYVGCVFWMCLAERSHLN
jgi:hypothetical protein